MDQVQERESFSLERATAVDKDRETYTGRDANTETPEAETPPFHHLSITFLIPF